MLLRLLGFGSDTKTKIILRTTAGSTNRTQIGTRWSRRHGRSDGNCYVYVAFLRTEFGSALFGKWTNMSNLDLLWGQNFIFACIKIYLGSGCLSI